MRQCEDDMEEHLFVAIVSRARAAKIFCLPLTILFIAVVEVLHSPQSALGGDMLMLPPPERQVL